jgi:hypothetical protein
MKVCLLITGKETVENFHFLHAEGWPDSDSNPTSNRLCIERRHWPFVLKERNFITIKVFPMTRNKPQEQT